VEIDLKIAQGSDSIRVSQMVVQFQEHKLGGVGNES